MSNPTPPPIALNAILTGKAVPFGRPDTLSAIGKRPVDNAVAIGPSGLEGDEQADRRNHGGLDKAIHHYPFDHYAAWRGDLPAPAPLLDSVGAFGENISTLGLTEETVCVGDVFHLGTATVQVSQGRQPCWKLNHRFGVADMARRVQSTGRTGWYYRVLEPGTAAAGDGIALIDRPRPDWPLARILRAFYHDTGDLPTLAGIAALEPLATGWRTLARRRVESGRVEDWSGRLGE
ncbi:molybdenum cofactor sulfurase [Azospirillum sp. TSH100]|uniref:MOSC domain-containing protein n=1 Tax=Azospirillum sp. TSH100 TaxID=652764 RepID=UPI000D60CD9B|nr:MOSC domain-containing protein [Azospirillum sp. TSH100]PWC90828.1 molybdenum cofactor sulfurase [Azospirillum sp. TSH100]QCG90814.1 MOSC domain-containing protein [Azospirillum sp. TSH100]